MHSPKSPRFEQGSAAESIKGNGSVECGGENVDVSSMDSLEKEVLHVNSVRSSTPQFAVNGDEGSNVDSKLSNVDENGEVEFSPAKSQDFKGPCLTFNAIGEDKESITRDVECLKEKAGVSSIRPGNSNSCSTDRPNGSNNDRLAIIPKRCSDFELTSSRKSICKLKDNQCEKPVPLTCNNQTFCGEKLLRKSPRFLKATENGGSYESLKDETTESSKGFNKRILDKNYMETITQESTCLGLSDAPDEWSFKKHKVSTENLHINKASKNISRKLAAQKVKVQQTPSFIGDPIPSEEAQERWGWRYEMKNKIYNLKAPASNESDEEDKIVADVECHYAQAQIDGCIYSLGDCALIQGEELENPIGRIVEFFKTSDGGSYFRVQWFYRAEDTVLKHGATFLDKRRLFCSNIMNDNPIDCIISKVKITKILPKVGCKLSSPRSDFYYDMEYCVEYSTFRTVLSDKSLENHGPFLPTRIESVTPKYTGNSRENMPNDGTLKEELELLDLYSGCGGMSTGLCLGAKLSGVDLVTRWAVDGNMSACRSLKLNHPETHVRNDSAEDFLELLKEWKKLCKQYLATVKEKTFQSSSTSLRETINDDCCLSDEDIPPGEFEVGRIIDICFGDPNETGKRGLMLKVHWKGYSSSDDSWEPIEGLRRNCKEHIQDFVRAGFKAKILPIPGTVDVICGGPPCQGISGYNRFRNFESPLNDERNRQIVVFMDIVEFLKPKFVLMENVVDILRFDKGSLGRYALSRLVDMKYRPNDLMHIFLEPKFVLMENVVDILRFDKGSLGRYALSRLVDMKYQTRLGTMAAGCYGLPQFRLRVFMWGAHPSEKLPQFPLPTHDVIVRYWPPIEFERNTVAYDEGQPRDLEKALVLQDAISDLPAVTNEEDRDVMSYVKPPETEFQRHIRSIKPEMTGSALNGITAMSSTLYDHRPNPLFDEDLTRVCLIPKRKGANFRDLPGVVVGGNGVVCRDPTKEKLLLPSGRPLVPDYVFTFEQGKSKRPFARVWWDETVPTVVTFPFHHSQAALHPEQDRVFTIREYARLQGFPDHYRFHGTVKERYCQIGNAVAVPVSRALGYAMGMAYQKLTGNEPLLTIHRNLSKTS